MFFAMTRSTEPDQVIRSAKVRVMALRLWTPATLTEVRSILQLCSLYTNQLLGSMDRIGLISLPHVLTMVRSPISTFLEYHEATMVAGMESRTPLFSGYGPEV